MDFKLETYRTWAPDNALWTAWAKPVLFAGILRETEHRELIVEPLPDAVVFSRDTAYILDLPAGSGVVEGIRLAKLGYRPVPVYNGVSAKLGIDMTVDVRGIEQNLVDGAKNLAELKLSNDAPPAFLLDSDRMKSNRAEGKTFDNRWTVFAQDMPSAAMLQKNGIRKIVVCADTIRTDLAYILCDYQKAGVKIFTADADYKISPTTVTGPSKTRKFLYRFLVTLGLKRNSTGGFGAPVPDPYSSGHYGVG